MPKSMRRGRSLCQRFLNLLTAPFYGSFEEETDADFLNWTAGEEEYEDAREEASLRATHRVVNDGGDLEDLESENILNRLSAAHSVGSSECRESPYYSQSPPESPRPVVGREYDPETEVPISELLIDRQNSIQSPDIQIRQRFGVHLGGNSRLLDQ